MKLETRSANEARRDGPAALHALMYEQARRYLTLPGARGLRSRTCGITAQFKLESRTTGASRITSGRLASLEARAGASIQWDSAVADAPDLGTARRRPRKAMGAPRRLLPASSCPHS
jgi:hypothetical protein